VTGPQIKWADAEVDLQDTVGEIIDAGVLRFSVGPQGQLFNPHGDLFVPVGPNVNGQNWVWGDPTIGVADMMDTWSFNAIRVNNFIRPWTGFPDWHNNDDLAAIVDEYTAANCVVILANHTYGATTDTNVNGAGNMQDLINWWQPVAEQFKDNAYVWFNPINEPTGHPFGYSSPEYGLDVWLDICMTLGDAISEVAPHSTLLFDGHGIAQEKGHPSCLNAPDFTWPPFQYSAAIQRASILQGHFGRNRVIMSAHFYGIWAGFGTPTAGCIGPDADPLQYFREDANYYFDTLRDIGVPMVVGEFGSRTVADEEWFMAGNKEASHIILDQVLPARSAPMPGMLFWHGSGGDLRFLQDWNVWSAWDGDRDSLNWQGQAFLDYARSVNP
jgi:hypothetical protein